MRWILILLPLMSWSAFAQTWDSIPSTEAKSILLSKLTKFSTMNYLQSYTQEVFMDLYDSIPKQKAQGVIHKSNQLGFSHIENGGVSVFQNNAIRIQIDSAHGTIHLSKVDSSISGIDYGRLFQTFKWENYNYKKRITPTHFELLVLRKVYSDKIDSYVFSFDAITNYLTKIEMVLTPMDYIRETMDDTELEIPKIVIHYSDPKPLDFFDRTIDWVSRDANDNYSLISDKSTNFKLYDLRFKNKKNN